MHNSAYIKTWIGAQAPQNNYESAGLPRGGGWGSVKNITFSNFVIDGADSGPAITQDNGNNGSFSGSSLMDISDIHFVNFTGKLSKGKTSKASINCSRLHPCFNITFSDFNLIGSDGKSLTATCRNTAAGGVRGLDSPSCS